VSYAIQRLKIAD